MLCGGEYLSADATGNRVINGFSVAIDSDVGLSLIDLSEDCCLLSHRLSPCSVLLTELLRDVDSQSGWLPSPSWTLGEGSREDSLVGSGGVGDLVVICTGSSQYIVTG